MPISNDLNELPETPIYYPNEEFRETAIIQSMDTYKKMYLKSIENPAEFWREISEDFYFKSGPTNDFFKFNFDIRKGPVEIKWMEGAITNVCYNVIDRNIEKGLGDRTAIIWEGSECFQHRTITYNELKSEVCKFANVLKKKGIVKGDKVAIYLPVTIELVVSMLACARIGAIHSVIFAGFSGDSIAERILDCNCKLLITCDGVYRGNKFISLKEMADHAVQICKESNHHLNAVIVYHHLKYSKQHEEEHSKLNLNKNDQLKTPSQNNNNNNNNKKNLFNNSINLNDILANNLKTAKIINDNNNNENNNLNYFNIKTLSNNHLNTNIIKSNKKNLGETNCDKNTILEEEPMEIAENDLIGHENNPKLISLDENNNLTLKSNSKINLNLNECSNLKINQIVKNDVNNLNTNKTSANDTIIITTSISSATAIITTSTTSPITTITTETATVNGTDNVTDNATITATKDAINVDTTAITATNSNDSTTPNPTNTDTLTINNNLSNNNTNNNQEQFKLRNEKVLLTNKLLNLNATNNLSKAPVDYISKNLNVTRNKEKGEHLVKVSSTITTVNSIHKSTFNNTNNLSTNKTFNVVSKLRKIARDSVKNATKFKKFNEQTMISITNLLNQDAKTNSTPITKNSNCLVLNPIGKNEKQILKSVEISNKTNSIENVKYNNRKNLVEQLSILKPNLENKPKENDLVLAQQQHVQQQQQFTAIKNENVAQQQNQQASVNNLNSNQKKTQNQNLKFKIPWNPKIDYWWHDLMNQVDDVCEPVWVDSEHPLFILYTSGSTGKPKGVVHTSGGYMIYAATTFKYVFNYHGSDVFFCTADLGWITGHTVNCYGSLANAATIVLFDGTPFYPTASRLWQIVCSHRVNIFYTAPTAIRSLMGYGEKWIKDFDLSSLKLLGTAGEPINPEAWHWYYRVIGKSKCPIVDTWWQTETGAPLISSLPGCTPMKPGSATYPFFGVVPALLDDEGKELSGPATGHLVFKSAWPGMIRTVDGNHHRFQCTYFYKFPGYYCAGDGARRDEDGCYWITGRTDDLLNVSGHLLSTAQVESALTAHEIVAEAAAVSAPHKIKGECIYCYIVLKKDFHYNKALENDLKNSVRYKIGAIATPEILHVVSALPKTRSGKIMRRLLRQIAKGETELGDISTLQDESVLAEIYETRRIYVC